MNVRLSVKVDSYMVLICSVGKEMDTCATSNTNVKLSRVVEHTLDSAAPYFDL